MAKIPASAAASMFEQILGWPYSSPGVTDDRGANLGIDCSGAWVRVYQKHGKSLYHGSNYMYRNSCSQTGAITDAASQLRVGMSVYKCRPWRAEDAGHRDYGKPPGNLYHVGCVTSVNPLRVCHATTPRAKADAGAKNWTHFGALTEVELGAGGSGSNTNNGSGSDTNNNSNNGSGAIAAGEALVSTQTGPLNLRQSAPLGTVLATIPRGETVTVLSGNAPSGWTLVRYGNIQGLVSSQYLEPVGANTGGQGGAEPVSGEADVVIRCASEARANALAAALRGLKLGDFSAELAKVTVING